MEIWSYYTGETIGFVVRDHLIEIPNSARIRSEALISAARCENHY